MKNHIARVMFFNKLIVLKKIDSVTIILLSESQFCQTTEIAGNFLNKMVPGYLDQFNSFFVFSSLCRTV